MQVIPAINASDFKTAEALIKKASDFSDWVHIDVGDGQFSSIKTWDKPEELLIIQNQFPSINVEAHLMVVDPLNCAEAWLAAGVKRLIIHLETLPENFLLTNDRFLVELMLSINPETPVEKLFPYLEKINHFQILAVVPGKAGQLFEPMVLEKIKILRAKALNAKIEVDGGITAETAMFAKNAGADIVVSASYIFNSDDPAAAYQILEKI